MTIKSHFSRRSFVKSFAGILSGIVTPIISWGAEGHKAVWQFIQKFSEERSYEYLGINFAKATVITAGYSCSAFHYALLEMEWMEKIIHLEPQGRWYLLRKYYSAMNPQDNIKKNFKPTYSIITERLYSFEEYLTYDGDSSLVIFVVNSMDHSSLYLVGPVFKACERAEVVIAGILIWPNGVEDSLLYENAKEYISYMKRNADFFYLCEGYGN